MKNLKNLITSLLFLLVGISAVTATNNLTIFDQNNLSLTDFTGKKPAFENVSICRIQLKVKTNGIENANTDNSVWVNFNEKDKPFYLNLSKDDRERNQTDIYDVMSLNVNKINDRSDQYLQWALYQLSIWKGIENLKTPIIHIHVENDKTFPINLIENPIIIKKGTHVIIYNKA